MTRPDVLLYAICLLGVSSAGRADPVHVEQAQGDIRYGAGNDVPSVVVKAGQDFGPGTFSAGANGILFLSTFAGSNLRLGETGTLQFYGAEMPCVMNGHPASQSSFRLKQGKLIMTITKQAVPSHCYHVEVERGGIGLEGGQCVMCMHGDGSYVYVARGRVSLFSGIGAAKMTPVILTGNGSVGMLEKNGNIRIRSLAAVAPATQNCLLAGFKPDATGGGLGSGRVDPNAVIVSPIQ